MYNPRLVNAAENSALTQDKGNSTRAKSESLTHIKGNPAKKSIHESNDQTRAPQNHCLASLKASR